MICCSLSTIFRTCKKSINSKWSKYEKKYKTQRQINAKIINSLVFLAHEDHLQCLFCLPHFLFLFFFLMFLDASWISSYLVIYPPSPNHLSRWSIIGLPFLVTISVDTAHVSRSEHILHDANLTDIISLCLFKATFHELIIVMLLRLFYWSDLWKKYWCMMILWFFLVERKMEKDRHQLAKLVS